MPIKQTGISDEVFKEVVLERLRITSELVAKSCQLNVEILKLLHETQKARKAETFLAALKKK